MPERPRQIARRLHGLDGQELAKQLERVPQEFRQWVDFYVTSYAADLERRAAVRRKVLQALPPEQRAERLRSKARQGN